MYKIIVIPQNAVVPEDIRTPLVADGDIIERIIAGKEQEIITPVSARELQLIVEYRDLFKISVRAVIGLQGTLYSTIWNMYVSSLPRITLDNLRGEEREANDEASDAGQNPASTTEVRSAALHRWRTATPDDADPIADIEG